MKRLVHALELCKDSIFIPDEGVQGHGLDIVKLLQGVLDLPLVRLGVHNEDEGVVLLNLLHRALGVERVDDDLGGIEAGLVRDRLARVLGRAREGEGLRQVERSVGADLADLVRVDLLQETGRQNDELL